MYWLDVKISDGSSHKDIIWQCFSTLESDSTFLQSRVQYCRMTPKDLKYSTGVVFNTFNFFFFFTQETNSRGLYELFMKYSCIANLS